MPLHNAVNVWDVHRHPSVEKGEQMEPDILIGNSLHTASMIFPLNRPDGILGIGGLNVGSTVVAAGRARPGDRPHQTTWCNLRPINSVRGFTKSTSRNAFMHLKSYPGHYFVLHFCLDPHSEFCLSWNSIFHVKELPRVEQDQYCPTYVHVTAQTESVYRATWR
ncbi:hypothetical protein ACRALDRAFT_212374 [Sodiomyces alcalophilus JCM 7366]|uniref:uncharacterized protein n=1 Tax=Sodiomyces alcalophilus JCM 7366 TaxID=591952 RepID=UPI0039B4C795